MLEDRVDRMGEHLADLRKNVSERRLRSQILWTAAILGLLAHSAAYLLRSSAPTGVPGLLVDLIYALGYALWTGVVVVAIVEIIPRAKERQIQQAIDAYEAAVRQKPAAIPGVDDAAGQGGVRA
jgi:hypothetical protein